MSEINEARRSYFTSENGVPNFLLHLRPFRKFIEQFNVIKTNQQFITDADLCYYSYIPVGSNRIRGILQTYESDGTITEQDIEYGFDYGEKIVSAVTVMEGKVFMAK